LQMAILSSISKTVWVVVLTICAAFLSFRVSTYDWLYSQSVPIFILAMTLALFPFSRKDSLFHWIIFCVSSPIAYLLAIFLYVSATLQFVVCGGALIALFFLLFQSDQVLRIWIFITILFIFGAAIDFLNWSKPLGAEISNIGLGIFASFEFRILVWQSLMLPMIAVLSNTAKPKPFT
jgi:hypothetical protein